MIAITTSEPFTGYIDSRPGGRPENQDSCGYADTPFGLLVVVCDGMGGGPGGKLASSMAVDVIISYMRSTPSGGKAVDVLQEAVQAANRALVTKISENPSLQGMGTTVAALVLSSRSALTAHVGDSRIYQFRQGKKKFRTDDHSIVSEMVRNHTLTEEQARLSPQSNVITRALGIAPEVMIDVHEQPYEKGDRFMLCTDGIWGAVPEKRLIKIAARTPSLSGAVESLVIDVDELGFANGGQHDNLTVVLINTHNQSILKEKMSTQVKYLVIALSVVCCISISVNILQYTRSRQAGSPAEAVPSDSLREVRLVERMRAEMRQIQSSFEQTIDSLSQLYKESGDKKVRQLLEEKSKDLVVYKLNQIIEQLKTIRDMDEGAPKAEAIRNTLNELEAVRAQLEERHLSVNWKYNNNTVFQLLKHNIAQSAPDDKSIGHFNIIIQTLEKVKEQVYKSSPL